MLGAILYAVAFAGFLLGCLVAAMWRDVIDFADARMADDEGARPRIKPFNDPGGYAAHGDWPFVPSDLKVSRFHARVSATKEQQRAA